MNCQEFHTHLATYVDGELGVDETLAAGAHVTGCPGCRSLAARERQFRQLLRRQPRESAPAEFRARIIALCQREARRARLTPWLAVPALAAAAALVAAVVVPGLMQPGPLVGQIVDTHITFAQIERPAELTSADRHEVREWFLRQATMQVTVPDYSPAGIRLVGARIASVGDRKAAYVLYEKGHTLLSVFMVPASGPTSGPTSGEVGHLAGSRVSYRGHEYLTQERKGFRTLSWTDGDAVFGLVSMLDYRALLECANRLRAERAVQTRL